MAFQVEFFVQFREEIDGRSRVADSVADWVEHLHDLRVVWPPEVQGVALWKVILVSWSIAFFEYCLQVPANRLGSEVYSPEQLKVMQEVITLGVFGVFTVFYFGDRLHWNHAVAAGCLVAGRFSCSTSSDSQRKFKAGRCVCRMARLGA